MNRIHMAVAAVMLLCSRCALAQPVFFDDFDGDDLKPWWSKPPDNQWDYTVANSLLSVTYTKDGAAIGTMFDPLGGDSEATASMGWEPSNRHEREFTFGISTGSTGLAFFSFTDKFQDDLIRAHVPGYPTVTIPAPPPGIYDFTIRRAGGEFQFLLDNSPVATFPDDSGDPLAGVFFNYSVVGNFDALLVDRVQVVPAPGAMVALLAAAGWRRRRS